MQTARSAAGRRFGNWSAARVLRKLISETGSWRPPALSVTGVVSGRPPIAGNEALLARIGFVVRNQASYHHHFPCDLCGEAGCDMAGVFVARCRCWFRR